MAGLRRLWQAGMILALCASGCASAHSRSDPPAGPAGTAPLVDSFTGPDGLISSERRAATDGSPWVMTSGSLFRADDEGWTGRPDDGRSSGGNGSSVFRMVSARRDFSNADVSLRLRVDRFVASKRTPTQEFDGAHVWVRYRSEYELYAVSVDRRDDSMIIKKKCPGGTDNGGTYFDLTPPMADAPVGPGDWQQVVVTVRDQPDGSVRITGDRDGRRLDAVDRGVGCAPLRGPGGVGLRGDNTELRFDDIDVEPR